MSDSKQPTNDIDALASKAQAMLARVKASADPLASTTLTSAESAKAEPSVDEDSSTDDSVAPKSAKESIATDAPVETPADDDGDPEVTTKTDTLSLIHI